ncbi:MAG: 3-keto-disaccharide hydrolase [Planctomycetota bacterium]
MGTKHRNTADGSFWPAPCLKFYASCKTLFAISLFLAVLLSGACQDSSSDVSDVSEAPHVVEQAAAVEVAEIAEAGPNESNGPVEPVADEVSLFDGKTLGRWQITDFGGQGEVYVKDGSIYLDVGNDMTGITWGGAVPFKTNYEITLEAMRVDGSDFFCGLTFPVGENFCSLVLGGWGGTLCGLSNIDYYDAANNETTRIVSFENGQWYHVRLHVRPDRIQAWLQEEGEEPLVDMDITGRKIDTRAEMDYCQPMGVATWQTSGAVRNMHMRKLAD